MKTKILVLGLVCIYLASFILAQSEEGKKIALYKSHVVYVIPGEAIFHLQNCEKLGSYYTGMSLEYALGREYKPCPICIPLAAEKKPKKIEKKEPIQSPPKKPVQTKQKVIKMKCEKGWNEVAQWTGKSIKNTETFHISSREWQISWETRPGEYGDMNFQIYIHKANGDLIEVAANVIGYDKDSTIIRGAGDYYLSINTAQPYTIIVCEKIR